MVEHNKITHELLSEHIALGSFEEMLAEADESSALTLGGKILTHIVAEVVQDVAPNFCYNSVTSRFVPSFLTFCRDDSKKSSSRCLTVTFISPSDSFGRPST